MDKIAAYDFLLSRHPLWEKKAFAPSMILPAGAALGGGVLGGIGGAMSTEDPTERKKRALMGAVGGGLIGGLGGEVRRRGDVIDLLEKNRSNAVKELSGMTTEANRADSRYREKVREFANLSDELSELRNTNKQMQEELSRARDGYT